MRRAFIVISLAVQFYICPAIAGDVASGVFQVLTNGKFAAKPEELKILLDKPTYLTVQSVDQAIPAVEDAVMFEDVIEARQIGASIQ
jgi:hypothetical protein